MASSSGETVVLEAGMTRTPEDVTLSTTAFGVLVATGAAAFLVVYAMLTAVHLIPLSVIAQSVEHVAF